MDRHEEPLCIAILGAGSIGCYLGGCLLATDANKHCNVTFIGRQRLQDDVRQHGLTMTDWRGRDQHVDSQHIHFTCENDALADADFILLCVKSQDTQSAAAIIKQYASDNAIVVSFQNGVTNGAVLSELLSQQVIKGMVPFNVFYQGKGHFHCGTEGNLAIQDANKQCSSLVSCFNNASLPITVYDNISNVQYGKLIMNLNNAVNALSGIPLKEQLSNREYRKVIASALNEALTVLSAEGIEPARTGKVIPKLMPKIMALPNFLFNIVAASTLKIDPQARSSMYEDLVLGRRTEIDYLNGEIDRLGKKHGIATPVNSNIVALIKQAERDQNGSPMLSPSQLL